jgi:hypothetical protein
MFTGLPSKEVSSHNCRVFAWLPPVCQQRVGNKSLGTMKEVPRGQKKREREKKKNQTDEPILEVELREKALGRRT